MSKNKWDLVATVHSVQPARDKRGKPIGWLPSVNHIHIDASRNRLRCNCRKDQPYKFDADGKAPDRVCEHVVLLYMYFGERQKDVVHTPLGRELFYPIYTSRALRPAALS